MDQDDTAELQRLRARAYGPAAEAEMGPADWERLERLESAARPATWSSPRGATEIDAVASPTDAPTLEQIFPVDGGGDTDAAPSAAPEPAGDEAETEEPPRSRRRLLLWIGSLVATAAVCIGVTYTVASVRPVSPDTGAQQVATLTPVPDATWAVSLGTADVLEQYEFLGLSIAHTDSEDIGIGSNCLVVTPTASIDSTAQQFNSWVFAGCKAGRLPAMVQFEVPADAPTELRDRYPAGSGLRFVAGDGVVGVFVAPADE